MTILGMALGAVAFLLLMRYVDRPVYSAKKKEKQTRDPHSPTPIAISAASIADDLMPLLIAYAKKDVLIKIVGADCHYAQSHNGQTLISGLATCLEKGAEVDYHLLCPSEKTLEKLKTLHVKYMNSFRLFVVRENDSSAKTLLAQSKFEIVHPTLIIDRSDARNNAMWLERYHPKESDFAYGVIFVSSEAMDQNYSRHFRSYLSQIEEFEKYSELKWALDEFSRAAA